MSPPPTQPSTPSALPALLNRNNVPTPTPSRLSIPSPRASSSSHLLSSGLSLAVPKRLRRVMSSVELSPTSATASREPSSSGPTSSNHSRASSASVEGGQKGRETPEEEEGYESDSSDQTGSSFGSLLARVDLEYAKQRSKGKEREAEELGVLSGEEEEEDGEEVGREEGARDPRDMLREQLKRSESRGRVRALAGSEDLHSLPQDSTALRSRYISRRYFILSTAGKLIFTTDTDEEEATSYVGVMQAIVSIFVDEGDKLRYINAGDTAIFFLLKPPLYLVVVSSWGEPEAVLRTHLEYLYAQVLSIISLKQLQAIFKRRQNFDLRRMLEGTESFFTTLITTLQTSLPIMTSSLSVYSLPPSLRSSLALALKPTHTKDLLYVLLVSTSTSKIISILRPASHSIHPLDIHLLISTIEASPALRTDDAEAWIPICLPRYNSQGFLHAYLAQLGSEVGLVLVGSDGEAFGSMKEYAEIVRERLRRDRLVESIEEARKEQSYGVGELAIPGLRHFLYMAKAYVQVTAPVYEGDYAVEENQYRLITLYQRLYESLHTKSSQVSTSKKHAKQVYIRTEHEAILGWASASFEVYVALPPLMPKSAVVAAAKAVTKWAKGQETRLFLTSAPSF